MEGADANILNEHILLLYEADFVEIIGTNSITAAGATTRLIPTRLTWDGQEFLATIRSDIVWKKTKETAVDKGIDLTIPTIAAIASGVTTAIIKSGS